MSDYQICTSCVMDNTADDAISFDAAGVCNYCTAAKKRLANERYTGEVAKQRLQAVVDRIKADGKRAAYDCVIGVSGGVDSSYVAYLVKKLGLRPLAVHFDNGWNSELAVKNIESQLKALDVDYYNYVMDWEKFRDIQGAFLKASLPNLELPTDHAIIALLYQQASKHGIKHIIVGSNLETESIMPSSWMHFNMDYRLIRSVCKRHGGAAGLRQLPHYSLLKMFYYVFIKKIRFTAVLNLVPFNKAEAETLLKNEFGWRAYGGKHHESIITRFFQGYILPKKFHMDKRRPHLASMIVSGQMKRDEALKQLAQPYHYDQVDEDLLFVAKKFGYDAEAFQSLMKEQPKPYDQYPNNAWLFSGLRRLVRRFKRVAST